MESISKTLIFIDTETTGNNPEDRLIQVAYRTTDKADDVNELYKPNLPIKIGAMAVHHITEDHIADKPTFKNSPAYQDLEQRFNQGEIFVAHNAKFDIAMIEKEGLQVPTFIDTLKIARFLDPENSIESYGLQYLRYLLGMKIDAVAHDAFGDILVLEQLFWRLLKKIMEKENISADTAVDAMIDVSSRPLLLKYFNFGKYKNMAIEEVAKKDPGYLQWMLEQKQQSEQPDMEEDWIHSLQHYLNGGTH